MAKAKKLTDKQENFVLELVKGKSQREAYKASYNAENMKDETIDNKASKLFAQGEIRARYNKLKKRLRDEAIEQGLIEAKDIIKELASIAFDDIGNYLEYKTVQTKVGKKDGEDIIDYATIVNLQDSKTVDTRNIQEIQVGRDGQFKFKLYSKDTALQKLADVFGEDIKRMVGNAEDKNAHDPLSESLMELAGELDGD